MAISGEIVSRLRSLTNQHLDKSIAPYSRRHTAVTVLLSTGEYIPGVRVETASFPLAIPAIVNGFTSAIAFDRHDVVAVAQSHEISAPEHAYIANSPVGPFVLSDPDICFRVGVSRFPEPQKMIFPFELDRGQSTEELVSDALALSRRALIPESSFPVGAVARAGDYLIPGVNVEHEFWPFTLCAERNVIGTAASYGLLPVHDMYLSCPLDESATPCGACRQVLAELAPEAPLWTYRGKDVPPERSSIEDLLPGYFNGRALLGRKKQ